MRLDQIQKIIHRMWIVCICFCDFFCQCIVFFFCNYLCFVSLIHSVSGISAVVKLLKNAFCQFKCAGFLNFKTLHIVTGSSINTCFIIGDRICCSHTFYCSYVFNFFIYQIIYITIKCCLISQTVIIYL